MVDRVLVFDGGCIVEDGSPDELLASGGLCAKLYESQAPVVSTVKHPDAAKKLRARTIARASGRFAATLGEKAAAKPAALCVC